MNKVTTDFAMGIADKDLSEELQVKSEQLWEVECKCLASHRSTGAHWEQTGAFSAESETHPGVGQAGRTAETWGCAEIWNELSQASPSMHV